jgi:hypothetical protein
MGDNRNARSWGKTIVFDQKDQLSSNSTSSPAQKLLHRDENTTAASFNRFYRQCLG